MHGNFLFCQPGQCSVFFLAGCKLRNAASRTPPLRKSMSALHALHSLLPPRSDPDREGYGKQVSSRKSTPSTGVLYRKIRHPQAAGELPFWWVFAFALHFPFLALFSFLWVPVFALMCLAEERDLLLHYGETYEEYRRNTGFMLPRARNN